MDDEIFRYIEPVYRFCLKRLSSRGEAEDLSQEILLCVIESLRSRTIENLEGYVLARGSQPLRKEN